MSAPAQPSGNRATFANLLSSLTDTSQSAADVATISYEQALGSHRRVAAAELLTARPAVAAVSYEPAVASEPDKRSATAAKQRKTASVTIRISEVEQAQLQERAGAAQISVSAYLRSCIFEVESLRTQVKETLARIRAAADSAASPAPAESAPAARRRFQLFPRWKQEMDQ